MPPMKYWLDPRTGLEYAEEHNIRTPYGPSYRAAEVEVRDKWIKDRLEHIIEYWNGSSNERAMQDALEHILDEAARLLKELT